MVEAGSAVTPYAVQWELRNQRRQDTRTYEQRELSIEGEARLIGLAQKVGAVLGEAGYTFGELDQLLDENRDVNWSKVMDLIGKISASAPDLAADTAVILLGIYPTDEDGTRNEKFDDERVFIKGAINLTRLGDMLRTFVRQNDYERLTAPFSVTLSEMMAAYGRTDSEGNGDSSEPSEPGSVVGTDGSLLQLEHGEQSNGTQPLPTTEPQPSETRTDSDTSLNLSLADTEPLAPSGADTPTVKGGASRKPLHTASGVSDDTSGTSPGS